MPNLNLQLEALQQLGVEVNGYGQQLLDLANELEERQNYLQKNVATGVDISSQISRVREVANNLHGWSKTFAQPEVQAPENVPEVDVLSDGPEIPEDLDAERNPADPSIRFGDLRPHEG